MFELNEQADWSKWKAFLAPGSLKAWWGRVLGAAGGAQGVGMEIGA